MHRIRPHWAAAVVVALFLGLGLMYSSLVPVFEASDELHHYPFIEHLARGGGLPVQHAGQESLWQQEGSQPPLYYAAAALLTSWIDTSDLPVVRDLNPHARIGMPLATDNRNMIIHSEDGHLPGAGRFWPST
jgi:hypothetical protein